MGRNKFVNLLSFKYTLQDIESTCKPFKHRKNKSREIRVPNHGAFKNMHARNSLPTIQNHFQLCCK